MQKLLSALVCLSLPLFFANCGKKKEKEKRNEEIALLSSPEKPNENVASRDNEHFVTDPELLDEATLSDFAFIDDADSDAVEGLASNVDEIDGQSGEQLVNNFDGEDDLNAVAYKCDRIQFDYDKNSVKNDQNEVLEKNYQVVKNAIQENKAVTVHGHTCQIGSARHNLALSLKRAETVKEEMVKRLDADQIMSKEEAKGKIRTMGLGYESPLVWSDESDRDKRKEELSPNRRAEISIN